MQSGTHLTHYTTLSAIGRGGMGEVWKANDTKLGREIAIKTLLASLNHPNIAAIHGFVPAWKGDGVDTEEVIVEDGFLVWRRD